MVAAVSAFIARQHALSLPSRIEVTPNSASVFAGSAVAFHARLIGGSGATPVRWSLVGPGSISQNGIYAAPSRAGESAIVVAAAGGVSQAVNVVVNAPPGDGPLLLISCYEGNLLDVRLLPSLRRSGVMLAPELAAGIAVDPSRRVALVAAKESVLAIDLRTMKTVSSAPLRGSRFSGVVLLAGGYFAATDNNASRRSPGVDFFRVVGGTPVWTGSIAAGETPEGIVAEPSGRTFYVTNVNSNEVIRYAFDAHGGARVTGRTRTGNRPFGIALDASRKLLFVTDNDTPYLNGKNAHPGLEAFALPSLRRVGQSIGTGSKEALPIGAAVDPNAGRLFVTNEGDANVVVFALPSLRRVAALPTGKFPWTPRVDGRSSRLYVPSAHDNLVDIFDTRSLRRTGSVSTCEYPTNVMVAPGRS